MDLSTEYCGLKLKNPIIVSSSPFTRDIEGIRRVGAARPGAMILHSLFEEEIDFQSLALDHHLNYGAESFAEATSYFPELDDYGAGPEQYLDLIRSGKDSVDIPIIASLNGTTPGGWVEYARQIEAAGADALELNVYYLSVSPDESSAEVEERYLQILKDVKREIKIPVIMKIGTAFSSLTNMAVRLSDAGANGIALFNRFYQPDLDIENLEVLPTLELSSSSELRQRIRWTALLYGKVKADIAVTGGVHTSEDVLKALMAGAKVAMMTSKLLRKGLDRVECVNECIEVWLNDHGYESVKQIQGILSQGKVPAPAALARANYVRMLQSYREDPSGRFI